MQKATFAAGCFWGIEESFRKVKGVISTTVGYSGGSALHPSYEDVCTGTTGHAESVEVVFDPNQISYDQLLDLFWTIHDPTTANRQGPDIGNQYRSVIFFQNSEQENAAKRSKEKLEKSKRYSKPIVTQIVPAGPFYRAEDYHQQYILKRGGGLSCH